MVRRVGLKQGDLVPGVPFEPAGQLQFEQNCDHQRR